MTMPGQVSSASTAHQFRPSTLIGRTRKGRLRSPRVALNVTRRFSAFFIIGQNRPFCTGTTPTLFSRLSLLRNNVSVRTEQFCLRHLKPEPNVTDNIPHSQVCMPVLFITTEHDTQ